MSGAAQPGLNFRSVVAARETHDQRKTKGERTRARIRLATIDVLNEIGYRDMKVSDVCARAGISPPVLYLYFDSKLALAKEVLEDFLENFMGAPAAITPAAGGSVFEGIYAANLRWITTARANCGLIRCLLQLSEDVPEFGAVFAEANRRWYDRVSRATAARTGAALNEAPLRLAAYALGSMMDELARRLFAGADPHLAAVVSEVAPSDEELASFLSVIWFRALYAADPDDMPNPLRDLSQAAARAAKAAKRRARRQAS